MSVKLTINTTNRIPKGTVIYDENQDIESIALVIRGRVEILGNGLRAVCGAGSFLGLPDLPQGKYQVTYRVLEDAVVFPYAAFIEVDIENILEINREYGSLMTVYLNRYIRDIYAIYKVFSRSADDLYSFIQSAHELYEEQSKKFGFTPVASEEVDSLQTYQASKPLDLTLVDYYNEAASVDMDIQKGYYRGRNICLHHIQEQSALVQELIFNCREITGYIAETLKAITNGTKHCLFQMMADLIQGVHRLELEDDQTLMKGFEKCIAKISEIDTLMTRGAAVSLPIEREIIKQTYQRIANKDVESYDDDAPESITDKLTNSLHQILMYAGADETMSNEMKECIDRFVELQDKTATDNATRMLRKNITNLYYEIYKKCFKRAYAEEESPLVIDLFLRYGFMDERLLDKEQLIEIASIKKEENNGPCKVYDMKEWLTLIYSGERMPSKSEFDLDYAEYLRDLVKSKSITDTEMKSWSKDMDKRLDYEIENMFKYNNRISSGEISIFVPVLHKESLHKNIENALATVQSINDAVLELRDIDFSVFYRESFYENREVGVMKEYVMEEVYPEFILMPTPGSNGVMWQDISSRRRNTPARFLLPIFLNSQLADILPKLFGRFRWELCRTVQGAMWNDIKYKSLTSEYMDFIQFYRKNGELSEERREKVKLQIQKCRNNSREVFVLDYEKWVKNESQGAMRLSKPVREILATYCPFKREIRERLSTQPMFSDAMGRYNREKGKKIKELENRYLTITKAGHEIPEPLQETLSFYKDL
ncbi:MAG: cyclic nucleotide-binding domain-containing protein [Lachnospiraceae bacterium]|nr:cyclic nucleotide-binding domain-containing protein [Lachnospiraceae bacterium]